MAEYISVESPRKQNTVTVTVTATKEGGNSTAAQLLASYLEANTSVTLKISARSGDTETAGLQVNTHDASRDGSTGHKFVYSNSIEITLTASDFTNEVATKTFDYYVRADEANDNESSVGGTISATLVGISEAQQ